jgi:S-DNA-T family DNA segregation ATPase FtsK/SpoIIIE
MKKGSSSEKKSALSSHPEAKGLILLSCAFLALLSLLSFYSEDVSHNWLGLLGYSTGWVLNYLFGLMSYALVIFVGWLGWRMLCYQTVPQMQQKIFFFSLCLISCCILLNLMAEMGLPFASSFKNRVYTETIQIDLPYPQRLTRYNLGGVPCYFIYRDLPTFNLHHMLSNVGCLLTFSITGLVSFLLFTKLRIQPLIQLGLNSLARWRANYKAKKTSEPDAEENETELEKSPSTNIPAPLYDTQKRMEIREDFVFEESKKEQRPKKQQLTIRTTPKFELPNPSENPLKKLGGQTNLSGYQLPPPSLLKNPKKVDQPTLKKDLKRQAEILEETLLSFGIEAKVGEIYCGPTITSFEVHPAVGVKVQKITALENDIALKLQAKSIRIIAPIPGKAAVGVEIPSLYPQEVSFKELLLNYQQNGRKLHIPVLLGKTVSGENMMSDLTKMPHCIIAGATGSGKSVCINTLILSILMNARPDEIKLLMIDPKKVELTAYSTLPHMIAPVITEAHGAYSALNWLVKEMQTRYDILKQLGLRNISAFNARSINTELEASLNVQVPEKMHSIVAIIDEFADLMMVSSSDLETPIARIAQMARAVGIHLVLATQRPSREVITGLIKANFPTRIAFKVASRINSQIILDEVGAESLLGNGDMLFLPPGSSHLLRAQGAYVSDEEINSIISFICDQAPPNYLIPSFDNMHMDPSTAESSVEESSKDSLYDQALAIVLQTKNASTTYLQRKLKIGYARAASLMDELESNGVISPQEGSKPRRVLREESSQSDLD